MGLEVARPSAIGAPIVVAAARYVLLPLANLLTGYSVKAMERKIERGDWQEGKVWRRAPDGRILIDIVGYQRWIDGHVATVNLNSKGIERQKSRLPMQMDLTLRRENVTRADGKTKVIKLHVSPPARSGDRRESQSGS
jgi:hypothetical protein